jgi:hypothetical protein
MVRRVNGLREDQRVMAALGRQQSEGQFSARPCWVNMGQKPAAKLESIKLGLVEQQSQHIFPIHRSNPSKQI